MSQKKTSVKSLFKGFAGVAIPVLFIVAVLIYFFVLGNKSNFQNGDVTKHPVPTGIAHYLGLVYQGGIIVPFLLTALMSVLTFFIERFITINSAKGKGNPAYFIAKVHEILGSKEQDIAAAMAACDKQRGSLANVVKAGLAKYQDMIGEKELNRDQKVLAIKQEIEEATSLELPMLEQNLVILATIASVATLLGLLGTVIGMIKAFSALATAGAPDAVALASGISEALINTALGIGTSAFAIIFYNYFTTKIDKITYSIDEAGVALVQQFAAKHK